MTNDPDPGDWTPEKAALNLSCPRCEALPGEPCKTITGHKADGPHASRWEPLATAYGRGYTDAKEGK